MQLDAIGRDAGLSVDEVEEANTLDLDREVGILEGRCGGKAGVEFRPHGGHRRVERAGGAIAGGRRNFRDYGVSHGVLQDDVIIDVVFQLVEGHEYR